MTRTLLALALLAATCVPASAQTPEIFVLDVMPSEPAPMARTAPRLPAEPVIMIGDAATEPVADASPIDRVFADLPGDGTITRAERDAIDAEIAARFGRRVAPPQPVSGFVFAPDVSMLLKPTDSSGLFRSEDTRLRQR